MKKKAHHERTRGFTPLDRRRHLTGFTLIEVMISVGIFAGLMVSLAGFYVAMARMSESSRNLTQAVNDARVILEAIRDTAQSGGLAGGAGVTDRYPAGVNLVATGQPFAGLGLLPNEDIQVSYANPYPAGPINLAADPLPVTLSIDWDQNGHDRDPLTVSTLMTKR